MPQFKFRLATLLRLRELARDERRAELTQAYRAKDLLAEHQEAIERHLADLRQIARRVSAPGEIDVDRLMEARRFESVLLAQQDDLRQKQQMIDAEVERRRLALVEANREVQVLENLRRRQYDRHRAGENRREIHQLDEIAQQQAGRETRP